MGNESERRANESREPRSGYLFRAPIHSPWTQKKTLIYNASNKDPF